METKINFGKDGSPDLFGKALVREVNQYFEKTGKSKKGGALLHIKTFAIFALFVYCYLYAIHTGSPIWFLATGVIIALIGFNIMHDASHGSYSQYKWINDILGFLGCDLMGAARRFWHEKHDIMHHTDTNIVGRDNDISRSPLFRLAPYQIWKNHHQYQHIYCWPLYTLLTLVWFYAHDFQTYKNKRIDNHSFKMSTRDHIVFWLGKVLHGLIFFVIPLSYIGFFPWLIGFVAMHMVASFFLAIVFQMAHIVENLTFIPEGQVEISDKWYIHELKTTANFASKNWFWSISLGGLNYQVEHHLFRHISHIHYPAISKIVQKVCKEYDVPYHSFPTFRGAIVSHYRHMKTLGKAA